MARLLNERPKRRHGFIVISLIALLFLSTGWQLRAAQTTQDSDAILHHLNAAISWYRHIAGLDVTAGQPSDVLYLENARSSASQALQLAFQASLAQAALDKSKSAKGNAAEEPSAPDQQQSIAKAVTNTANRIAQTGSQIDDLNKQIAAARGQKRQQLIGQRDALQGQLDLDKTLQDALQKISSVAAGNENGSSGLAGQINQLKQSVPEVFAATTTKKDTTRRDIF